MGIPMWKQFGSPISSFVPGPSVLKRLAGNVTRRKMCYAMLCLCFDSLTLLCFVYSNSFNSRECKHAEGMHASVIGSVYAALLCTLVVGDSHQKNR